MDIDNGIGPFLVNEFGDRYLYDINGPAFNKAGSSSVFSKHYGNELFAENSLYIVVGSDSGLLPQFVVDTGVPEGSYYLFIEPEEVLEKVYAVVPEGGFHKKIFMTSHENWLACAEQLSCQNFVYLGQLKFSQSFAALDGRYSPYLPLSTLLKEELDKLSWQLQASIGTRLFLIRQLENLAENQVSAARLKDAFRGRTAVVLGAGPSLDECLPWILENRQHLAVVAVSRISRRLLSVGLTPDIVVSVDPQEVSFDVSKEMLQFWEKTLFVHEYHVVNSLLGQWRGRSMFIGKRVPWDSSLNDEIVECAGPTVTNSAVALCLWAGFEKVGLCGVDLCFSREGHTHAKGSYEREAGAQLGRGNLWVETNGGWLAETTADYHAAAQQIGVLAERAAKQGCLIVSLSESAAQISGVKYIPAHEVGLCSEIEPFGDILETRLPLESAETRRDYYRAVIAELLQVQKSLREMKKLSLEALKANATFFGLRGKDKGNPKHRMRMERIEKKLNNDFADLPGLVKQLGIRDFLKMTQGDQDREWDENDAERLGRIYYEAYRDSSSRLLEMLDSAVDRLQSRLEEENDRPDFALLTRQWGQDAQPGRSLVWMDKHPLIPVPAEWQQELQLLARDYEEQQDQAPAYSRRLQKKQKMTGVLGKLKVMYRQRQKDALAALQSNLEGQDADDSIALAQLAAAYLAELDEDQDCALEAYQKILDLGDDKRSFAVLEETLKRLLGLCLRSQDLENALLIAESLSHLSVTYLPNYADLLWLLGDQRGALDKYADYLDGVPNDHTAMIKVGRYYQSLGMSDGARMMFEMVLQQDQDNLTAKVLLENL